ncbi:hypothetical protein [Pseudohongiella sp. O18]|uniref:hypothetical protein n=1 Tax=Pseudohongiella sp. O18 TaxID=2904248 RepID=UPI001F2A6B8B|nr:hypothetical protein [Pseudohongiella sp. O18]
MLRKFIGGLVFGTGFAIALIIVLNIYFNFFFESMATSAVGRNQTTMSEAPGVSNLRSGFLGSPATYTGDFEISSAGILSSGAGEIKGMVSSNGQPTQGLRLRLALNGQVMSQWATTNDLGEYAISVPYGEYKIDGYEIDQSTANDVLRGLITSPMNPHFSGLFTVSPEAGGVGIDFRFVDPVIKTTQQASYNLNEPVTISWESYPGAVSYSLQVYEKSNPHEYQRNNTLFAWTSRPQVSGTSIDLKAYTQDIKPGYYYSFDVVAIGENRQLLSETARTHSGYDFKIE